MTLRGGPLTRPNHLVVPGAGKFWSVATSIVERALRRQDGWTYHLLDREPPDMTFSGRVALLGGRAARQLILVTQVGSLGPAYDGPQSYTSAAELLRLTRDNMYTEPTIHLQYQPPELDPNDLGIQDHSRYYGWHAACLTFTGVTNNDATTLMLNALAEEQR